MTTQLRPLHHTTCSLHPHDSFPRRRRGWRVRLPEVVVEQVMALLVWGATVTAVLLALTMLLGAAWLLAVVFKAVLRVLGLA